MQIFQNISIRRKQTLIIMLTSSVVLLLACAAFVAYDTVTFRQELSGQVTILADAVGNNCAAAIDFNDPRAAEETLAALRANANIVSACVYSRDGQVFAIYQRDGASKFMPPAVRPAGQEFTRDELHLFRVIKQGGEMAGTIFVASDLKNLSARLMSYVEIVGMVFLTALLAALLLSSRLQRLVSNPIMHLAQVARTVAQDKNYSVRATKHGNDEIGQLVEGFNEMLAQIQRRDAALQSTRDDLEVRVAERTADLEKTNAALDAAQGLYHSLVEQLPANVYRKDAEGRFIFVNSRFCKSKGKTADEILGQVASVVNSKEAVDRVAKEHELIMRTGRSIEKEEFYTQRDGTVQYLQVLKSPVLDADGKIIGTQGIQLISRSAGRPRTPCANHRRFTTRWLIKCPPPFSARTQRVVTSSSTRRSAGLWRCCRIKFWAKPRSNWCLA